MIEKIKLLSASLKDDLKNIEKIKSEYDVFLDSVNIEEPDIYQKAVIGYYLHNFYNACENIFLNIARTFENNIEPNEWHKSILKRMKLEIEDIRPLVISNELYFILDDFRAFRHVFRDVYSFELDWEREKIVALKFNTAVEKINKEINIFLNFCEQLIKM